MLQEAIERGEQGGIQLITRVEKELEAVTDLVKDNISNVPPKRFGVMRFLDSL